MQWQTHLEHLTCDLISQVWGLTGSICLIVERSLNGHLVSASLVKKTFDWLLGSSNTLVHSLENMRKVSFWGQYQATISGHIWPSVGLGTDWWGRERNLWVGNIVRLAWVVGHGDFQVPHEEADREKALDRVYSVPEICACSPVYISHTLHLTITLNSLNWQVFLFGFNHHCIST